MAFKRNTPADFWANVRKGPDCWTWKPGLDAYGAARATVDGVQELAHRVAYRLTHDDVPEGAIIRRTCNNRLCVNPDHAYDAACVAQANAIRQEYTQGGVSMAELGKRHGMSVYRVFRMVHAGGAA